MQEEGFVAKFGPHTALTAIDSNNVLQYFYISAKDNNIKRITRVQGGETKWETISTPAPRTALSAVLGRENKVVLFYQALDEGDRVKGKSDLGATGHVLLVAKTFSRQTTGLWDGARDARGFDTGEVAEIS
jgi:hypothetical protein